MSKKTIERNLRKALLEGGEFEKNLFEYELEEHIKEYIDSKRKDNDDYFFAITEHSNDVAMLFIDEEDQVYVNEDARVLLEKEWEGAYHSNVEKMLPIMAEELDAGYLSTTGVKRMRNA